MPVTHRIARKFDASTTWQRNYWEHVIRDKREMENIWRYIESNPPQLGRG